MNETKSNLVKFWSLKMIRTCTLMDSRVIRIDLIQKFWQLD